MEPDLLLQTLKSLRDDVRTVDSRIVDMDNKWDSRLDATEQRWRERHEEHSKEIVSLKAFKNKMMGIASVITAGITYLINYFKQN